MSPSLKVLLRQRLKSARFRHTEGVVKTAVKLARLHGVSVKSVTLAAWLHDCAKALERGQMKRLLKSAGADKQERDMPSLWHACVGAWLARHEYGVKDLSILKAIRYHSTGAPGMSRLQKLLFVADYIEPGRGKWPELKRLRPLALKDLNAAYLNVLSHKIIDLIANHRPLHSRSVAAYHDALK